ncbi:MAG: hypothetical protein Q9208_006158 [Pyrenodesmia sp. 3 TL-2023]
MKFIITEDGAMHIDHPPMVQWIEPALPGDEPEQSRTTDMLLSLASAAVIGTGKASKFTFTTARAVTAPLLLSVCSLTSLPMPTTNTSQQPLHSRLPSSLSDGIHKLYHWLGHRGTGSTETQLQTITRQEEELCEMAETVLALDEHDKDLATSVSSLSKQLGTLQLDYEALSQHAAVVEGQYERLGEELEDKSKEMERVEAFYTSNQSHYGGDMAYMQKKMKKAQDEAAEANDIAELTSDNNKNLHKEIKRQEERHTADVKKLEAIEKKVKELETQGTKDRHQRTEDAKKIEKLEKEAVEHKKKAIEYEKAAAEHKRDTAEYERDAEEIGTALAEEVSAKEEAIKELAAAKKQIAEEVSAKGEVLREMAIARKKIEELEEWEEVGLADRGSINQATQTEDSTPEEAVKTEVEIVKELDGAQDNTKPTYADASTQTDASIDEAAGQKGKIIDLEREVNQLRGRQTIVDVVVAQADTLDEENRELRSSKADLEARCTKLKDSNTALQADKTELENYLADARADIKMLTTTKESLEAKLVEVEEARSTAEQSRDAALQELSAWKAKHHQDVEDARVQAQQVAESEKAELREQAERRQMETEQKAEAEKNALREEAERRHEEVIDKMRTEAQEFEAGKNREIEELRSHTLVLNRQIAGLQAERDNARHSASFNGQRAKELEEQKGRAEAAIEKRDEHIRQLKQAAMGTKPPPQPRPGKALRELYDQEVAAHGATKRELKECKARLEESTISRGAWLKNEEGKWLAEKKKLVARAKELEAERDGGRRNGESYLASAHKAKEQCEEVERKLETLQSQIEELNTEKNKLEASFTQLDQKAKDAEKRAKKFGELANKYRDEIQGHRDTLGKRIVGDEEDEQDRSTKVQKTETFAEWILGKSFR